MGNVGGLFSRDGLTTSGRFPCAVFWSTLFLDVVADILEDIVPSDAEWSKWTDPSGEEGRGVGDIFDDALFVGMLNDTLFSIFTGYVQVRIGKNLLDQKLS